MTAPDDGAEVLPSWCRDQLVEMATRVGDLAAEYLNHHTSEDGAFDLADNASDLADYLQSLFAHGLDNEEGEQSNGN